MTDLKAVQAAPGRLVRDPQSKNRPIKPGRKVDLDDPFWYRRWQSGDIVAFVPPEPAPSSPPASPPPAAPAPKPATTKPADSAAPQE
ncbi:MAG TPA: DUF2635 domain-containing protein [Aliidongia sp.]|nr:DUF2635 domain-containing protein [Aliidongia sp.]